MGGRTVNVRRFSPKGSAVTQTAVEEAERIVQEARRRGALVVDEDREEAISGIAEETENVAIVDPLQGGA